MNQIYKIVLTLNFATILLFSSGCATQGKSVALGGAIGAGTGAVLGGIIDPGKNGEYRTRNVIIGSAMGGLAGIAAGSVLHSSAESKKREAYEKGQDDARKKLQASGAMPNLKNPKVEGRWIDGRIVGNRYIEGHFEYVIVEPARWEE